MKNILSIVIVFFYYSLIQSQNISADIEIDNFGNIFVTELINDLKVNSDTLIIDRNILIHNKYADLIGEIDNLIIYKPKTTQFSYVVNLPKNRSNSYLKQDNFIFNGINYLACIKNNTSIKKTFDIRVKPPKNFTLIYPDKRDLESSFYNVPPIIAGDFKEKVIQNYRVYTLRSEKFYSIQLNSIIGFMNRVFNFYSQSFGAVKQPKIIFLPFKGSLVARTIDNAIILNSNKFKYKTLNKKALAHEIAHLWWGYGGLFFEDHQITEGMADFMALQFLKQKDEHEYLKLSLDKSNYYSEGIYSLDDSKNTKIDKRVFSYNFIPILFQTYQNNNSSFYNALSEFYKMNKPNAKINLNDLNNFLVIKDLPKIVTNEELPDFFILEEPNFLVIRGATKKPEKVTIEYIKADNTISYDTLLFSSTSKTFKIRKAGLIKVSVDPDNKIHQFSKLNDVWLKDQQSLFSRNRYFSKGRINPKIIKISESVLNSILEKDNELENSICDSHFSLKAELKKVKKILKDEDLKLIIPTGAVATYNKKKHVIFLKLSYYSRIENKSKFLFLELNVDENIKYIEKIKVK